MKRLGSCTFALLSVLALSASPAAAEPLVALRGISKPVGDSLAAVWTKSLLAASTGEIRHAANKITPAPFKTVKPCSYREEQLTKRKLDAASIKDVVQALGLAERGLASTWCVHETCAGAAPDKAFDADLELTLGEKKSELVLRANFTRGTVVVSPGGKATKKGTAPGTCLVVRDGGRALLDVARKLLPKDASLAAVEVCVSERLDSMPGDDARAALAGLKEVFPEVVSEEPYPEHPATAEGRSGTVVIDAWIDERGAVRETIIRKSQGFDLDAAAVKALELWRFKPATVNGTPIAMWITVPVAFGSSVEDIEIGGDVPVIEPD